MKEMMLFNLFYILTVFPLLYEGGGLIDSKKYYNLCRSSVRKMKDKQPFESEERKLNGFNLFYFLWAFVGLFSSQWFLFALLIIISIIPLKKYLYGYWIDSLISFSILVFILINKYHLKIDLFNWFINLFN